MSDDIVQRVIAFKEGERRDAVLGLDRVARGRGQRVGARPSAARGYP